MEDIGVVKGTQSVSTNAANRDRRYTLHVPGSFQFGVPIPVVVLLHPLGGNGRQFLEDNDWNDFADREGFIAVAPDALGADPDRPAGLTNLATWSALQISAGGATLNQDVLLFDVLLADLSVKLGFPVDRVFIAGHSNGGSLGFVLASERPANVRALAPVAAHWIGFGPVPTPPTPTLFIVGTADPLAPLAGGDSAAPSIDFTLGRWALGLGCDLEPAVASDTGGLRTVEYAKCSDDVSFRTIFIAGHGHRWPGGRGLLNDAFGPDTGLLNATATIGAFFVERK